MRLLNGVTGGKFDGLECPKCRHSSVSAWFTHPGPEKYRTWLICTDCDFYTRVNHGYEHKPSFFSEDRVRPDLQDKDVAVLKQMRLKPLKRRGGKVE